MKEDEEEKKAEESGPMVRHNYIRRCNARKWKGEEPYKDNPEGPEVLIENVIAAILRGETR